MAEQRSISRRAFLASAAAAGATVATGGVSCSSSVDGSSQQAGSSSQATAKPDAGSVAQMRPRPDAGSAKRTIVVGAGFAGLTAALDLGEAGWDVVVLEARDRVGGRVHTLYDPFSGGLHAEGGGESIDDGHNAIQALVKRFGLTTERRPADKLAAAQVFTGGRRQPIAAFVQALGGSVLSDYTRFGTELAKLSAGLDTEHPERFAHAEELDKRTLSSFVDGLNLVPEARFLVETENRGGFNAELAEVSLLFAAQQSATIVGEAGSGTETMRISGGNSRLAAAMQNALGDRLVLNTAVSRIDWDSEGVHVTGAARPLDAARLVLALPPPPLRRITFSPALPPALGEAVGRLQLGAAAKVSTEYRRRFWTDFAGSGFTLSDLDFHIAWSATDSYGAGSDPGILSQFITGDSARMAAGMPDADRVRKFQSQLDQVYPEGAGLKTGNNSTVAWLNEQYTGGGYAVYQPGQLLTAWPALRAGAGPILFAGEHTEALAGYMESAVRSGHRVAKQIGNPPS